MSCCGKRREELHDYYSHENSYSSIAEFSENNFLPGEVSFQYTGEKTMTVIGSVSRKKYFFIKKGDVQFVNCYDAAGMMGVPNIRKVKS
ncbi:MAG: hypothetical protein M3R36_18050 [Bacteroidota bacterium]|nr:hypothetical protein [Bacteroidota bacterium]